MSAEPIQKKTELRTTTLMVLCMMAGIGLANMEVSAWWSVMLDTASILFERVTDVLALFFEVKKEG